MPAGRVSLSLIRPIPGRLKGSSMFTDVTILTWGKSDHGSPDTNEDAAQAAPGRGLFVLADGAGTTLFAREWARLLAQQYIQTPLLSADPFELQWWLELAQQRFQPGDTASLPWALQRKAREGSAATFAALGITAVRKTSARAHLFALGDTCVFVGNTRTHALRSFPLEDAHAFLRAPLCLSSLPRKFDRGAHHCRVLSLELGLHDIVLLATDAVACWLLRYADQQARWQAFLGLAGMTEETWHPFLTGCRTRQDMQDDDATIMIVRFHDTPIGEALGCTVAREPAVAAHREQALLEAIHAQDKERMAILYGDGRDFQQARRLLSPDKIADARAVAQALNDVRQTYFQTFQREDAALQVARAWSKHEALFGRPENHASVERLLHLLQGNGVLQDLALPVCAPQREVTESSPTFWTWLQAAIRRLVSR